MLLRSAKGRYLAKARSLRDKAEQWWYFLDHPEVPPDNNLAERSLRLAVTKRKVSGGSRSMDRFAQTADLLSVVQTCRRLSTVSHAVFSVSSDGEVGEWEVSTISIASTDHLNPYTTIAVEPEQGQPLGLLWQKLWHREPKAEPPADETRKQKEIRQLAERKANRSRPFESKESYRPSRSSPCRR